jgi:hypothetical protein
LIALLTSIKENGCPDEAGWKASKLYFHPFCSSPQTSTKSSSRKQAECTICGDRIRGQVVVMPCDHTYDVGCARDLFEAATHDESLFPPRCCRQEIPLALVSSFLPQGFMKLFENKSREFTTTNRLYCSNPMCSLFLGAGTAEPTAVQCDDCDESTCSSCKAAAHPVYVPCSTDEAAQQVLALARESRWQQCPSCHTMVELSYGCYHMTCRCNYSFCYICAVK